MQTAKILPYPMSMWPTPEQRLRAFVDELARELGDELTAKMLTREGYRLIKRIEELAPA